MVAWVKNMAERAANPGQIELIPIAEIQIGARLRDVSQAKVDELKASIQEIGLQTAISLRIDDDGFRPLVWLVAGAHRLEAMRQLGATDIRAELKEISELAAELWEIDENLIRSELSQAEKALCMARRKAIYLEMHPETAHGAAPNGGYEQSRQIGGFAVETGARFTAATAAQTGISERNVQRDVERGEKISAPALKALRGTKHDTGVVLDRLKKIPKEDQSAYVLTLLQEDKAGKGGGSGHAIGTKTASKEDRGDDLYETPIEATRVVLALESFSSVVKEPAVGRGAILRPLEAAGYEVIIADLVDRGVATRHGELAAIGDFLDSVAGDSEGVDIVTNPPYGIANAFLAHALREHKPRKMAALLNLNFMCGYAEDERCYVMDEMPPSRVYVNAHRLKMMHRDGWEGKKASSQMNTAWFIWERNEDGSYGNGKGYFETIRVNYSDFENTAPLLPGAGGHVAAPMVFADKAAVDEYACDKPRVSDEQRVAENMQRALRFAASVEVFDFVSLRKALDIRGSIIEQMIDHMAVEGMALQVDGGQYSVTDHGRTVLHALDIYIPKPVEDPEKIAADEAALMQQYVSLAAAEKVESKEAAPVDALYQSALDLVRRTGRASTVLFKKELNLGFNKASGLIERMEAAGLVSKLDGAGQRIVFMEKLEGAA